MAKSLTLIYTGNIAGNLSAIPRYAPILWELRAKAGGRSLLLDTGNACDMTNDACQLTGGRAAPIILDAVGYDAVNVGGYLAEDGRTQLQENYLNAALVDAVHPAVLDGIAYATAPPDAIPHELHIALEPGTHTQLSAAPTLNTIHTLTLAAVGLWQVGVVVIEIDRAAVVSGGVQDIPQHTPPDATISGTLDFVMDEVRFLKKRRGH